MRVAWLSVAPVKSMRLVSVERIELEETGVRGDRRFFLVDDEGRLVNAKRLPPLLTVRPAVEDGRLILRFPDKTVVEGEVHELGEHIETSFYGRPAAGRIVEGPWSEALSGLTGKRVRVARTEREGDGYDRGREAGASLVSTASLAALQAAANAERPVDGRRFRMTIGIDADEPHVEDGWIGSRVRVGGAVVHVRDNVGRCSVTTRDPDTGVRDLDTLGAIEAYRAGVPTGEPLPFGVWCEVVEPGPVAVGDPVEPG
ncbi:MAG: MOSC N-terminal beta barrel domain-containing protein [Gaiellaceae bacterium]